MTLLFFIIGDTDDNMYKNIYYIDDTINKNKYVSLHTTLPNSIK